MTRAFVRNHLYASLLILALLGMVARAVIPAGFMPDFSAQAGTPLIICSGNGEKTIYVDDKGSPIEQSDHGGEQPCVFALNFYAVQPYLPELVVSLAVLDVAFDAPSMRRIGQGHKFTYPARGPPVFFI